MVRRITFPSGFCSADNHSFCRGALRRPRIDDEERIWRCSCTCHRGHEVELPPEIERKIINPRLAMQAEASEWFSQLVIHGRINIEATLDTYKSIAQRLRRAAQDGKVDIVTRFSDGVLVAKIKPIKKKPRKKKMR